MKIPNSWECYVCDTNIETYQKYMQIKCVRPGVHDIFYLIHFDCFKEVAGKEFSEYFDEYKEEFNDDQVY